MVCKWLDLLLEYLLYVWDFLGMVWTWIITNAGTIESVCILTITVYTFYLTIFPKKLKFLDFEFRYTAFYGETIKVSLENRSLSSVCVRNIYIKVEDKYLIPIFSGHEEGYRIIDSFHAESFISTHAIGGRQRQLVRRSTAAVR